MTVGYICSYVKLLVYGGPTAVVHIIVTAVRCVGFGKNLFLGAFAYLAGINLLAFGGSGGINGYYAAIVLMRVCILFALGRTADLTGLRCGACSI